MDSQATPSKAGREGTAGVAADLSTPGPGSGTPAAMTMMDVSSPDPAPFSFARQKKHPPALSSKPRSSRKVSSLFSNSGDTGEAAGLSSDAPTTKKRVGDNNSTTPGGGSYCAGGDQAASPASASASASGSSASGGDGDGGGAGFTSPVRASRDSSATSSRFTPQRNLGGLFASPLPPPANEDGGGVTASPHAVIAAVPLLLQSPKREDAPPPPPRKHGPVGASCTPTVDEAASSTRPESQRTVSESPTASTAAASPAASPAVAPAAPAPGAAPGVAASSPIIAAASAPAAAAAPAATAAPAAAQGPAPVAASTGPVPVCPCGCSPPGVTRTDCGDVCCVSNKAFEGGKAMRTLEVLVKRERVGVSALASWRVAELKRRLVHLNLFPATEAIALVPTFPLGGAALGDDVVLDTLDADVTYKARRVGVAAS